MRSGRASSAASPSAPSRAADTATCRTPAPATRPGVSAVRRRKWRQVAAPRYTTPTPLHSPVCGNRWKGTASQARWSARHWHSAAQGGAAGAGAPATSSAAATVSTRRMASAPSLRRAHFSCTRSLQTQAHVLHATTC